MERKRWIDISRGLAMIFVIWGHVAHNLNWFFILTSPIKIPLFFWISGYLFNFKGGDFKHFFKNKYVKLIIPCVVLSILFGAIKGCLMIITGNDVWETITHTINEFLIGEGLWFIPCLILCEFFMFFVMKIVKGNLKKSIVVLGILWIVSLFFVKDGTKLLWGIDKVPYMTFIMATGYLVKNTETNLKRYVTWKNTILMGTIYILAVLIGAKVSGGKIIDVHNSIYIPGFSLLQMLSGCLFVVMLTQKIAVCRALEFVGKNTLSYYAFHVFPMIVLNKIFEIIFKDISVSNTWIGSFITTVVVALLLVIPSIFINRFLPQIVGKTKS